MLSKIQKLKELFDHSSKELQNDYWTEELLEIYADTLGERILWKWQSFLDTLIKQGIHPELIFKKPITFLDWGCGPGTASLAIAQSSKKKHNYVFQDRSQLAVNFAQTRLKNHIEKPSSDDFTKVIVISYVLSELPKADEAKLISKIFASDAFIWVDAGTHKESRRLSEIRNSLLSHFDILAPCPHTKSCPLSKDSHPNDWCHRFAETPQEAFHSAKWAEISKVLKIDLRSLPYSSLYGVKKAFNFKYSQEDTRLGRPRVGKHEITLDYCTRDGNYEQQKITKRENPELFKKLRKE